MLESGYIKLHRSMLTWEWYGDINTKVLFLHLLLTVNYEPQKWRGITVERGQRVASYSKLALETGLSVQSARTAIKHLISTGELTHQTTAEYGLFTISNYDKYQDLTPTATVCQQSANTRPTVDQQQCKKANKAKKAKKAKKETPPIPPQGESVDLFAEFWRAYPKKTAKPTALKAFEKIAPGRELANKILLSLEQQKQSAQWARDAGQYIPYPATWLNQRRWEDELKPEKGEVYLE